jgi:hypothetical protein
MNTSQNTLVLVPLLGPPWQAGDGPPSRVPQVRRPQGARRDGIPAGLPDNGMMAPCPPPLRRAAPAVYADCSWLRQKAGARTCRLGIWWNMQAQGPSVPGQLVQERLLCASATACCRRKRSPMMTTPIHIFSANRSSSARRLAAPHKRLSGFEPVCICFCNRAGLGPFHYTGGCKHSAVWRFNSPHTCVKQIIAQHCDLLPE